MERGRPLLIFDGDCGFCRAWIARWRRITGERVAYATSQEAAPRFPEIPAARFAEAVVLVEPDGAVSHGAEAVFRSLAEAPRHGFWLRAYRQLPGFAGLSELLYRLIARNRKPASVITRLLWGAHVVPPGETLTVWIFLRLLGVVYLMAFASLIVQLPGLIGAGGILPAQQFLDAVASRYGPERFWLLPTLAWLGAGDATLMGFAVAGMVLSAVLMAGAGGAPVLLALWLLYLSLTNVGGEFLWFQWDGLLLEAGFIAVFLASWRLWSRPARDPAPSRLALWTMRWLAFRLMFSSAVVKLSSGDASWRNLTALQHHYETQPLPPWTAWYAHHLPATFQKASVVGMFVVEGLVPFLIFAPRRLRILGAGVIASLQVLILVTGNYGFFNWLSLALCIVLLDDAVWPAWLRRRAGLAAETRDVPSDTDTARPGAWPRWLSRPLLTALLVASVFPLSRSFRVQPAWVRPFEAFYGALAPLRTVNGYGLFAVMTTWRPEIVIEGSHDGERWEAYAFRWKPGDLEHRPPFVAPHMPRLDWQMWFAAFRDFRQERWFQALCVRLLEASPPVLALFEHDPFEGHPPRFLRATIYDYYFTDAAARRETGRWWAREERGPYCPVLTIQDGQLVPVAEGVP